MKTPKKMLTVKPTLVIIENSSHIYFENYSHFQIMKLNYVVNTSAVSTQFQSYKEHITNYESKKQYS